jgi:ATP-dependent protease ClpP protease subunit
MLVEYSLGPATPQDPRVWQPVGDLIDQAVPNAGGGADVPYSSHAREVLELRRLLEEIYARHTGKTPDEVHDDMERDRFFGAEEAVEYGLVDRIVTASELRRAPSGFAAAAAGGE